MRTLLFDLTSWRHPNIRWRRVGPYWYSIAVGGAVYVYNASTNAYLIPAGAAPRGAAGRAGGLSRSVNAVPPRGFGRTSARNNRAALPGAAVARLARPAEHIGTR